MNSQYNSKKLASMDSIFLTAIVGILTALIVGGIAHLVSRVVFLALLFSLGIGYALRECIIYAIKKWKLKNPIIAGAIGLICGIIAYGFMHYCNYRHELGSLNKTVTTQESVKNITSEFPNQINKTSIKFSVKHGLWPLKENGNIRDNLKKFDRSEVNLDNIQSYLVWGSGLVLILWLSTFYPIYQTNKPFCERCQEWFEESEILIAEKEYASVIVKIMTTQRYSMLPEIPKSRKKGERCTLIISRCKQCNRSDAIVKVLVTTLDYKGNEREKEYWRNELPYSQWNELEKELYMVWKELRDVRLKKSLDKLPKHISALPNSDLMAHIPQRKVTKNLDTTLRKNQNLSDDITLRKNSLPLSSYPKKEYILDV